MPYDAFISYASADIALAEDLYARLTAEGFTVWFDKARMEPGFDWHSEIEEGCENSRVMLPVLTPSWLKSEWTRFETYGAEAVIPLLCGQNWNEIATPPLLRFQAEKLDLLTVDVAEWTRLVSAIRNILAKPPPEKTHRITHLHYRANEYFTGRERELVRIHEEIHRNPTAALTQGRVRAIAAMGGAGKTTLARQYAEKFWRCYPQMFWVDCRRGLEPEYAHIHDIIFPDRVDIGLKESDKAASALHALNSQEARLLILDNAEDEGSIMAWIPKTGGCHILITSRFSGFSSAIKTIYLYVLEKEPSVEFLQKRSGRVAEMSEMTACEKLAEQLGYLPLALEQAAAYIEQQGEGFGFENYLGLYEQATLDLLDVGALGSTEYPDSVVTTWKSTIAKLPPLARTILRLCAFLAETQIAIEMLVAGVVILRQYSAVIFPGHGAELPASPEILVRTQLGCLKAYSMIRLEGQSFSVHPLLQTVERLTLGIQEYREAWMQAAALLCSRLPPAAWKEDCRQGWNLGDSRIWSQILHHVKALRRNQLADTEIVAAPCFLFAAIDAYASEEDYTAAIAVGQELCSYLERVASDGRSDLCRAKESLAYLLKQCRQDKDALDAFRGVYGLLANRFGEDDEGVLRARHSMACTMTLLGDREAAEPIMRDVLDRRQRVLGAGHYDSITSIHDLGWLLQNREDGLNEAKSLLCQALEHWKRTLEPGNPDIRAAASNLASVLNRLGDFGQAEEVQRDLLDATRAALGEDHLACFEIKHNLGLFVFNNGRFAEALDIITDVVAGYRRYLPPDHRNMLTALQDLGTTMGQVNRLDEAEELLIEALSGYERTQGHGAVDTLRTINNLAGILSIKKDWARAEKLLRKRFDSAVAEHGPDHKDSIDAANLLAVVLANKGEDAEAERLFRMVLNAKENADESATMQALEVAENLYAILGRMGKKEEAMALGEVYLDRAASRPNIKPVEIRQLAAQCYANGDYMRAESLLRNVLQRGFEVPGTHCHLARVLILAGHELDARESVTIAWAHRTEAPPYVVGRILWFQLAFALLDGASPAPFLGRLKTGLQAAGAHMEWTMDPALGHLQPKLSPEAHALLTALVAALSDPANVGKLDDFPEWRATTPLPLD